MEPERSADQSIVTIDIVSDVVCPWCYIGKRRLEKALSLAPEVATKVRWRPFQLAPDIPPEGLDRRSYLKNKFGSEERIEQMHQRITAAGALEGIPFAFDKIKRSPNTLDAHRLIRWSAAADRQDVVVEALFKAYFVEGQNIGDAAVLRQIAEGCGLDGEEIARLLDSHEDRRAVREEIAMAGQMGISGVPFFIFAGRYAVSGADAAETLAKAIQQAASDPVAA